jgi:molybdate/tungstate transport system ATP-binding protein
VIQLEDIHIQLPGFSVSSINLEVDRGGFFALIGPTGAGKTLILECIAGLIKPSRGRIMIGGREVTGLPPEKRRVGIVYQDHALFPHLTVEQNIRYGLRYIGGRNPDRINPQLMGLIERLGISHLKGRRVNNLSGGEKQRTALARALAVNPEVLLLDEPLSALDPNFRNDIRAMLADLHHETGLTCLMVTHDFSDVLTLADRMAVLNNGRLEQCGEVAQIFKRPASRFVAGFVGIKNVFAARFQGRTAWVEGHELRMQTPAPKEAGHICIRAEELILTEGSGQSGNGCNTLSGRIKAMADFGSHWEVQFEAGGLTLHCAVSAEQARRLNPGSQGCRVAFKPEGLHCIF